MRREHQWGLPLERALFSRVMMSYELIRISNRRKQLIRARWREVGVEKSEIVIPGYI